MGAHYQFSFDEDGRYIRAEVVGTPAEIAEFKRRIEEWLAEMDEGATA